MMTVQEPSLTPATEQLLNQCFSGTSELFRSRSLGTWQRCTLYSRTNMPQYKGKVSSHINISFLSSPPKHFSAEIMNDKHSVASVFPYLVSDSELLLIMAFATLWGKKSFLKITVLKTFGKKIYTMRQDWRLINTCLFVWLSLLPSKFSTNTTVPHHRVQQWPFNAQSIMLSFR